MRTKYAITQTLPSRHSPFSCRVFSTQEPPSEPTKPSGVPGKAVNCIASTQAQAFCIWDGGFLPSEAEWNYAAAGGAEQRVYPWSSPATSTSVDTTRGIFAGSGGVAVVGSRPLGNGRYGQSDLAGNLWEWAVDGYVSPYAAGTCTNCSNVAPMFDAVNRGGGFDHVATAAIASLRNSSGGYPPDQNGGIRCARPVPSTCTPTAADCADVITRRVCNGDGVGYTASACASGQSCSAGTCAVRCGDGIIGTGETCDDGNHINGDGCSSTCTTGAASGWVVQLSENFDDGVADGWTTCTGCAGYGCPGVSGGGYLYPADWNRPCLPSLGSATDQAIRFDFRITTTTTTSELALSVRNLGTGDEARAEFGLSQVRYRTSVAYESTIPVVFPTRPSTHDWSVLIDRAAGMYSISVDGAVLGSGAVTVHALNGVWGIEFYAIGQANVTIDDVVISTRP